MKVLLSAAAAAFGMLPVFAGTCIVRGSTERPCASSVFAVVPEIEGRAMIAGWGPQEELPELEARAWWLRFADPLPTFRSDEPSGFMLYLR